MSRQIPFTMHIKIAPLGRSGLFNHGVEKRFEGWRSMQKIAALIYDELDDVANLTLAKPGGGQYRSLSGTARGGLSGLVYGGAVKPQIGLEPPQVMLAGFWATTGPNDPPFPEHQKISGGTVYEGSTSTQWVVSPKTAVDTAVKALKDAVTAKLDAELSDDIEYSVYRLEFSGIIYGNRGRHFPV